MSILAILGFATIAAFMTAVMTHRLSAYTALVLMPLTAGLLAGQGSSLGNFALDGVTKVAPTTSLLLFAVLFFSIMIDAGLFRPLERRLLQLAGDDPVRIVMATAVMALIVSLDGDGATTILIVTTAFLPLYIRHGINPLVLGMVLAGANTVMNLSPWGGPTGRAAAALHLEVGAVFTPLIPVMAAGIGSILLVAWHLGRRERRRLAQHIDHASAALPPAVARRLPDAEPLTWRYPLNLVLTIGVLLCAVLHLAPLPLVFMVGLALGLTLNFPDPGAQRERLAAHAQNAMPIIVLILAAGVFTGVLEGTGMLSALAREIVGLVPRETGHWIGPIIAVLAIPLTFFLSNDAYYFGVLPILEEVAAQHGVGAAEVARASLLAQPVHALSPLVAAVYLTCSILKADIGEFQRFAFKWLLFNSAVMIAVATILGVIW
jgi:citrate-Mg2+:H+ or citrate-Ca2+:H+ symporter, CitMHS family